MARELLSETTPHFTGPPTRRYAPTGGGTHHFEVLFNARDGERFYGLGQHQHGLLNQKGAVVELVQRNTEVSIPFLVSNLGYGLLWNHPGIGRVELGVTVTRWVSEATRQWDYWITAADDPADLLRQYGEATGRTPDAPRVGLGLLAVQAPLQDPGRAARRRPGVQAARAAALGHRRRLLPLDPPGRLEVRPGGVARPRGDGRGTGAARREADGVDLAHGQPADSENYAEMDELGLLVDNEQGISVQLPIWDRGSARRVR